MMTLFWGESFCRNWLIASSIVKTISENVIAAAICASFEAVSISPQRKKIKAVMMETKDGDTSKRMVFLALLFMFPPEILHTTCAI
jgi:hypothetical protein